MKIFTRFFCLILLLISSPVLINGQTSRVDSLKVALKKERSDSVRCVLLSELAETADDNEWPLFNTQLKDLCEAKLKTPDGKKHEAFYLKYLAGSLNNSGFFYSMQGDVNKAIEYDQAALKIFRELKDTSGATFALVNLGAAYERKGEIAKALTT